MVGFATGLSSLEFWLAAGALATIAVVTFIGAFIHLHRARLIEDVPTSLIRSASQGYVELQGIGRLLDGPVIAGPLSGKRCTWWSYRVEERGGGKDRRWITRDSAASERPPR